MNLIVIGRGLSEDERSIIRNDIWKIARRRRHQGKAPLNYELDLDGRKCRSRPENAGGTRLERATD